MAGEVPVPPPLHRPPGLAQASQSSGETSPMEGTASSVISDDAIMPKIVHCSSDFKRAEFRALRHEALKNHLVRVLTGPRPLLGRAYGPTEQSAAEHVAGDPGGWGR